MSDKESGERLSKRLARQLPCSRREAELQAAEEEELARRLIRKATHWGEDPAGQAPLKAHFRGLVPLLPLAPGEEGLLVFTQDRGVARRLGERGSRLEEEWQVEVIGSLDEAGLEALRSGTALPGQLPGPARVSWQSETRLRFAIKGRASGLLEPLCRAVGLTVVATRRLRLGGVSLGAVPPGEWRYLKPTERF